MTDVRVSSAGPADGDGAAGAPGNGDGAAGTPRGARGGAVGLAGAVVNGLGGFVLTTVIVRAFGAQGAGGLFSAIGLITILGAVCCLGADTGLVFSLPRRRPGEAARLLPVAVGPPVALAVLVAAAGLAVGAPALSDIGPGGAPLLRLALAGLPLVVASTVLLAAVRAVRPVGAYVGVQFVGVPVARPVLLGGAVLAGGGVVAGFAGWLLPVAVAAVAGALLLVRPLGLAAGAGLRPRPGDWRAFWGFALPRAASAAIDAGSMWVGVLLTAALASPAEAGIFAAAGRYALAGLLVMQGLRVAVAPGLSRLLGAGRRGSATDVYRRTTLWVVVASWPAYLLLAAFAPAFLHLFGAPFAAGATPLAVLAAAMGVNVGVGLAQTVLLMSGNSRRHLCAAAAGLVVTLTTAFLLVRPYGAGGTALAWALGIVTENVLAAVFARRVLGHPLWNGGMLRAAATALAVTGVAAGTGLLAGGRDLPGLAVALGVLTAGALAALADRRARSALRTTAATLRTRPAAPIPATCPTTTQEAHRDSA